MPVEVADGLKVSTAVLFGLVYVTFGFETIRWLLVLAESLIAEFKSDAPAEMQVNVNDSVPESSATVTFAIGSSVGGITGSTVTVKLWVVILFVLLPLFNVTVMTAVPVELPSRKVNTPVLEGLE